MNASRPQEVLARDDSTRQRRGGHATRSAGGAASGGWGRSSGGHRFVARVAGQDEGPGAI